MKQPKSRHSAPTSAPGRFLRFRGLRLLSLALCLALLLSLAPGVLAAGTVDFQALAASGDRDGNTILVTVEPKFYVDQFYNFHSDHFIYRNPSTMCWGIMDTWGHVCYEASSSEEKITRVYGDYGFLSTMHRTSGLYDFQGNLIYTLDEYEGTPTALRDSVTGEMIGFGIHENPDGSFGKLVLKDGTVAFGDGKITAPRNGIALFNRTDGDGGLWGAMRLTGEEVLPCVHTILRFVGDDALLSLRDGKFGIIRLDGSAILPYEYEMMAVTSEGILAKKDGKWGLMDARGSILIPFDYDALTRYEVNGFFYRGTIGTQQYMISMDQDQTFCGSRHFPADTWKLGEDMYSIRTEEGVRLVNGEDEKLLPYMMERLEKHGAYLVAQPAGGDKLLAYDLDLNPVGELPLTSPRGSQYTTLTDYGVLYWYRSWKQDDIGWLEFYDYTGKLVRTVERMKSVKYGSDFAIIDREDGRSALLSLGKNILTGFDYFGGDEVSTGLDGRDSHLAAMTVVSNDRYVLLDTRTAQPCLPAGYYVKGDAFLLVPGTYFPIYNDYNQMGFAYFTKPGECPFRDAKDTAWYAANVNFCVNAGLMNGVGSGKFNPTGAMTRAMLVQVLYNISGEKTAAFGFTDVPAGKWYSDAVNWAATKGFVNGVTPTTFNPNGSVTREQMVTILYRYAQSFGVGGGSLSALDPFTDKDQVGSYARQAMAWAVETGIINGKTPTTLVPKGTATRAEIATVLARFVRLMAAN